MLLLGQKLKYAQSIGNKLKHLHSIGNKFNFINNARSLLISKPKPTHQKSILER